MDKEVIIRTFPTKEGDTVVRTRLSVLTPEKVFTMPFQVAVGDRVVNTWDELLEACNNLPEPVEITRFAPIAGG